MSDTIDRAPDVAELPAFDEEGDIRPAFIAQVHAAIEAGDGETLKRIAGDLHEADLGTLIEALPHDDRPKLVGLMGVEFDFAALTEVEDSVREDILEELPNATIAAALQELDSDDAVYILEDMAEEDQEEVLAKLPASDRRVLEKSLDYPDDSAGRRMQTEFVAVPPFWTVGQTIDMLREAQDAPESFYALYVVNPAYALVGIVPLDRLLRAKRPTRIEDIMAPAEHVVAATDDQHDAAVLFRTYNLVSVPVTDEAERLVGVLTFDDIVDVVTDEADAEIKALGGVKAEEELNDTVLFITRSRFAWLLVNLMTAFAASLVLKGFEDQLQQMVALAILAPIVASQGGNAATQTMTVVVRALATDELTSANTWRIIRREVMVGFLNGMAFAAITGGIAALWFQTFDIGIVIGIAMVMVLVAAALAGVLVPLILERCGVDPAISSGPFVTTVTDVVGFFAFLGTAALWFGI
jgi:magnesium transporter